MLSPQKNNTQESTQEIILEIIKSIKEKFFQPLVNENKRMARAMEQMKKEEQETVKELKERLEQVEKKVEENPVTVLSAIRDAIEQSYGGKNDGSS